MKNICYDFKAPTNFRDYIFGKIHEDTIMSLDKLKCIVEGVIALIPNEILSRMEEDGWKIIITNQRNLEKEYNFDFEIYGLTDFSKKEILVYANSTAIKYSIPHEIGHYVDSILDFISQSTEWKDIFQREQGDIPKIKSDLRDNYFILYNTPEEFFAECFGAYILMKDLEKEMLRKGHLLHSSMNCIGKIIKILPYIEKKEVKIVEQYNDRTTFYETKFW